MSDKISEFILKRFMWVILVAAFFVTAAAFPLRQLRLENSVESWMDKQDELYLNYESFIDHFGSDDALLLAFSGHELSEASALEKYSIEIERLLSSEIVQSVQDPLTLLWAGEKSDQKKKVSPEEWNAHLEELSQSRAFNNYLVAEDGETLGLVVILDKTAARSDKLLLLNQLRDNLRKSDIHFKVTGPLYFSETIANNLSSDIALIVSLLFIMAALILLFAFRNFQLVASILLGVCVSLALTLSLFPLTGTPLSLAGLIIFPLLFCVGITNSIHLYMHVTSYESGNADAFKLGVSDVLSPAFAATLTTAIGTTAFAFAPQQAIKILGLTTPLGILFVFIATFTLIPSIYRFLSGKWIFQVKGKRKVAGFSSSSKIAALVMVVFFTGSALFAGQAIKNLKMNPDALFFFKKDSELRKAYDHVENRLTGTLVLEGLIESRDGESVVAGKNLAALQKFTSSLAGSVGFVKASSILEPLDIVLGRMHKGGLVKNLKDASDIKSALEKLDEHALDVRHAFLSSDERTGRISLRYKNTDRDDFKVLQSEVEQLWDENVSGLSLTLTGIVPLILNAQDQVLQSQMKAFSLILGLICLCFLFVFRSFVMTVMALIANGLPIIVTLGLMGFMGMTINSLNIFVGAIILGVIVDDTIFLLYGWRKTGSIAGAIEESGAALTLTSIVVVACFSVLLFSRFVPIEQFGILSIVAVATAYLCDLYFLPALITLCGKEIR